jgi:hypothetical protein
MGEGRTLDVLALSAATGSRGNPSGAPRFDRETWEVTRGEDLAGVTSFEIVAERSGYRWNLVISLDSRGLESFSRTAGPRGFSLRRR